MKTWIYDMPAADKKASGSRRRPGGGLSIRLSAGAELVPLGTARAKPMPDASRSSAAFRA